MYQQLSWNTIDISALTRTLEYGVRYKTNTFAGNLPVPMT